MILRYFLNINFLSINDVDFAIFNVLIHFFQNCPRLSTGMNFVGVQFDQCNYKVGQYSGITEFLLFAAFCFMKIYDRSTQAPLRMSAAIVKPFLFNFMPQLGLSVRREFLAHSLIVFVKLSLPGSDIQPRPGSWWHKNSGTGNLTGLEILPSLETFRGQNFIRHHQIINLNKLKTSTHCDFSTI